MTAARYWPVQSDAIEYQLLPGADVCVHVLPPIVIDDNRWSGIDKHDKNDDNNNVLTKIGIIIIAVVIN